MRFSGGWVGGGRVRGGVSWRGRPWARVSAGRDGAYAGVTERKSDDGTVVSLGRRRRGRQRAAEAPLKWQVFEGGVVTLTVPGGQTYVIPAEDIRRVLSHVSQQNG